MRYLLPLFLLAGCGTTVNMNAAQPNLQSLNFGQPNCTMDCHTIQTATQGEGTTSGDVTKSNTTSTTRSIGSQQ
jgi:hypothetical protein